MKLPRTSDRTNRREKKRTADLIAAVEVAVTKDRHQTIVDLDATTGATTNTVLRVLMDNLGLVKKIAYWVRKLLSALTLLSWNSRSPGDIQVLPHPPYLLDLAPADFFFIPKMKEELAGCHMAHTSFKKAWEGVASSFTKDNFAVAFWGWFERSDMCVLVRDNYVEKS